MFPGNQKKIECAAHWSVYLPGELAKELSICPSLMMSTNFDFVCAFLAQHVSLNNVKLSLCFEH